MKKKRIAYILEKFPSPTEYFIYNEITQLEKTGFEIVLLVLKRQKQYEHLSNVNNLKSTIIYLPFLYYYFPLSFLHSPSSLFHFRPIISSFSFFGIPAFLKSIRYYGISLYFVYKQIQCDRIHAHFAFISANTAYYLSKILNVKYSFTAHAQDIYTNESNLRQHLSLAQFLITCTDYNKEHINKLTNSIYKDKIYRVYHGISIGQWPLKAIKANSQNVVNILTIARLVEKKGFIYLLQAINKLVKEGIQVNCTIIGEGALKAFMIDYIKTNKLHNFVRILPFVTQKKVLEYFNKADVFILPSIIAKNGDRDGLPNVILEAMLIGIPVISTSVSAIPEAVKHEETGILVGEKNDRAISSAIKLLMNDHKLRKNIIVNARKKIKEKFSLESNTKELIKIYNKYIFQT